MKRLLFFLALAVVALAFWYFGFHAKPGGDGADHGRDLPAVRAKLSQLTPAGQEKLRDIRGRVDALLRNKKTTKERFEEGFYIADDLRRIGDYESAVEWYLQTIEWYEALTPGQRQTPRYWNPDGVPSDCVFSASACLFFLGRNRRALNVMKAFLDEYPRHPMAQMLSDFYQAARRDPASYIRALSHLRASKRYVTR